MLDGETGAMTKRAAWSQRHSQGDGKAVPPNTKAARANAINENAGRRWAMTESLYPTDMGIEGA